MNKEYLTPDLEIVRFEAMDVITASAAATNLDDDETDALLIPQS